MAHPKYLRDTARRMRIEKELTIDELAYRLKLPRTTVFYWVRDIPIPTTADQTNAARRAGEVSRAKYLKIRQDAYEQGKAEFDELSKDQTFRDFICMYIGEGYKRSRNTVQICNSDVAVMRLSHHWLKRFSKRPLTFRFQHHADQDPAEVQAFWGAMMGVEPSSIRFQRKSNSGEMNGRSWRSAHGVLSIESYDTHFRARLQAWIDRLRDEWTARSA